MAPKSQTNKGVSEIIARQLRAMIVEGTFPLGSRLPTRRELGQTFSTTPVTMQVVFDLLTDEGYVYSLGRRGTFVAAEIPPAEHYGLVFPYPDEPNRPWPLYWKALAGQAAEVGKITRRRISICYGNEGIGEQLEYRKSLADLQNDRFSGLIFATPPFNLQGTPLVEKPGLSRVAIADAPVLGIPSVALHGEPSRGLDYLKSQGHTRVALLMVPHFLNIPIFLQGMPVEAEERGLTIHPYWVQATDPARPQSARQSVRLLMAAAPKDRPNGLLILDDNLVEQATAGIVDVGLRVPEDILIVGHCNYPLLPATHVPVAWFGFDMQQLLMTLVEILDIQGRGEVPPPTSRVRTQHFPTVSAGSGLIVSKSA